MKLRRLILILSLFLSSEVLAGPKVEIQDLSFVGTGCPKGSTDVHLSKDARRIDVLFNQFFVEADVSLGSHAASKTCDTFIRVKIPHGFSLAVERVKYSGLNDLPFGSNAQIQGEHFLNREELAVVSKRFYGNTNSAFDISARIPNYGLSWTSCGEEVVLASSTRLAVSAQKSLHSASVQVDDQDLRPGMSYDLLWRSCKEPLM